MPINGVAHFHVVSRHALGDRSRRAADAEKPAHDFLPGADLRERSVPARIEIDLQRLGMRIDRFLFHVAVEPGGIVAAWNSAATPLLKPPHFFRQTQHCEDFEVRNEFATGYVEPILARMRQQVSGSADRLRSGSNIGSSRSNAGVSGGFAAKGASYGIESSFSKVAMERSWSPMRAATRARMSSGLGPSQRVFLDRNHRDRALGQSQCSGVVTKSHICKREISHAEQNFQAVL